jgi:hypothetical protein
MRLGDLDFPIDARTLEGGAISWTDRAAPARAAAVGCPARATRRLEELEAAAKLQASLAATEGLSGRWCSATGGFVETDGREAFYIVSRLPDGAQPLAELLEQAEAAPGGLSERRRATLAWSLGVGVLRALLDLHERGTHHGELSPESAMRDRIIVRPRTTDPKDLEVDVALQFPSPRLALLLAGGRQPELGSAEQTDAARLAHILRAILHGRDVLDPDTGVDEMLLSRVFGARQQAWLRFFEGAAAGAWHADPDFIRSQLALLEPARPVAGGSGQLHDALFRLRRFFAKPAARWGAAAACATLVATVGLVLARDTLFPPPAWTVERVEGELEEKGELTIRVKTEGGDPPTAVTATAFKGDVEFKRIEFDLSESNEDEPLWKGTLPDSDQRYTIVFADKNETTFEVSAEDARPQFNLVKATPDGGFQSIGRREMPQSDDNGLLECYVRGVDEDSSVIAEPEVKIDGRAVELVPVPSDPRDGSGTKQVWRGTIDLGDLQDDGNSRSLDILIADAKVGSCRLLDVPYTLNLEPEGRLEESQPVRVTVRAKEGRQISKRPLDVTVSYDRSELKESGTKLSLDGPSAEFTLPESRGPYEVAVTDGKAKDRERVQADDDEPRYKLERLAQPAESEPFEVMLAITVIDPDASRIERPALLGNGKTLQFDSSDPPSRSTNSAKWTGKVTLPRGDSEQTVVLAAGSAELEVQVPAAQSKAPPEGEIAVNNPTPTPPPPPPPVTLTARLLDPKTTEQAGPLSEGGRVRIEPVLENVAEEQRPEAEGALAWELVYAPEPLKSEIERQLGVVNGSLPRAGEITAPEYNEDYSVELRLRSSDDRRLKVDARSLVIPVVADDDPPSVVVALLSAGGKEIDPNALETLDSTDVKLAIGVEDVDSEPVPPTVQVNGREFRDLDESTRSGRTVEFVGSIPTPPGVTTITITAKDIDKTYKVRWEPRDPTSAGLPDYGWEVLKPGGWISKQIGISADEFKLVEQRIGAMTGEDLQRLLKDINDKARPAGLVARLVTLEELKQAMGTPSQGEVVAGLIPKKEINGVLRNVESFGPLRQLLLDKRIDLEKLDPDTSAPQERRITFCSLSDSSTGIVGLPLVATLKSKREIEPALGVLLNADGGWDPKPWKPGTFPNAYAVIVVEKAVGTTADPGPAP